MFYYSKTLVFEVWEGPKSCLFRVVFSIHYFQTIFDQILWICWISGSPWSSKWVSFGDLEGTNLGVICDSDGVQVPRWLPGSQKEPFGVTLGCLLEVF